ncbi:TIGR02391 family protein [Streptomyces cellulosae]
MGPRCATFSSPTFSRRQDDLNEVLVHVGLRVNDQGQGAGGRHAERGRTARQFPASRATPPLHASGGAALLHPGDPGQEPLPRQLEAVKSVADRLRQLTGQGLDGARLVDAVSMPGHGTAQVAINANVTGPELDEQKGLANLVKGLCSMYRNPAAHEPRLHRTVIDEELLELLTTLSMVHRRLDRAHITP